MTPHEKIGNIVAFLSLLFGEDDEAFSKIMDFDPRYIIEKYDRYMLSSQIEYPWGLHPALRKRVFQKYIDKWHVELTEDY